VPGEIDTRQGNAFPLPEGDDYLEAVFGRDGLLAREFDGYKIRSGQVELAEAVDAAIRGVDEKRHLLAEGPTGTGKSLAYCVPATYHAKKSQAAVVIATANIALQEQLVEKDLPLLARILPWRFSFALLKGIGNFLCLDALEDTEHELELEGRRFGFDEDEHDRIEVIRDWARATQTGDVSELPFEPKALWSKFSTTADDCKRDKCDKCDDCFALAAIARAKGADVIVTNFHMLFAHIKVARQTAYQALILPPHSTLILDEAHKAADTARDFFGMKIGAGGLKKQIKKARTRENGKQLRAPGMADTDLDFRPKAFGISEARVESLEGASNKFFSQLTGFMKSREYQTRLKVADPVESSAIVAELTATADELATQTRLLAPFIPPKVPGAKPSKAEKRKKELELVKTKLREVAGSIVAAMQLADEPREVYFLEEDRAGRAVLRSKLVDVSPILRVELFNDLSKCEEPENYQNPERHESCILTSATLSTGGRFDWIGKEVGAPPEKTRTLIADSPFDFESQALLIVPNDVPFPNGKTADEYRERVPELMLDVIELAQGRTLCLFTSYRNLNATRDAYRRSGLPYRLLVQGDAPRTKLVEEFKADESSVLLGTESFWAGVDCPGEALSCVAIDRIPFATPDDPVLDMISAHNDRWFFDYSIPRACIQFKQGAGRLIRTVTDSGVVVCFDRRIVDKSYGRIFVKSLPPMAKTRRLDALAEFLNEL